MVFDDLRDFISFVEETEDLRRVDDANEDLEIGGLVELAVHEGTAPALLFDDIQGYPEGHRILANSVATAYRWLSAAGFEPTTDTREAILKYKDRDQSDLSFNPPRKVTSGPVLDNVMRGDEVNIEQFPAPIWHENDGGRFIGTGDVVITEHAETSELNMGTYRSQVHGSDELTVYISPGKDGRINRRSFLDKGEPCPMVVSVGHPPDLFLAANERLPTTINELEFVGGVRGQGVEVIEGEATGLPIPAHCELVFEGYIDPDAEPVTEGPFGEWTGYYAGGEHVELPLTVERVYYRDDPINLGAPPLRPPAKPRSGIKNAAQLWNELESSGIPGISEVSSMPFGPGWFEVVSISQQYGGHSAQVGQHAASGPADAYHGRFTVVVDDDIDVFDQDAVMWAICSRCDPAEDIHILENCWSTTLDPTISPERRKQDDLTNSRAIIDATRPYHWRDEFPDVNEASEELKDELREKWADLFEQNTEPVSKSHAATTD